MSIKTLIEWATDTVNFVWGCAKVSPACMHCYAVSIAMRFSKGRATWGTDGKRWDKSESAIVDLLKIARRAKRTGERPRVFINSMSDTFEDHEALQFPRINLFQCIETYPEIDFLLLTKRPENIMRMIPEAWHTGLPRNVWMGTTVENQETADERIPALLAVPARVRFLSCEPLLGALDLSSEHFVHVFGYCCETCGGTGWIDDPNHPDHSSQTGDGEGENWCMDCQGGANRLECIVPGIHWVICGGESGPNARPMHPDWARSLRDQCQAASVPFFFKQWGEWVPLSALEVEGRNERVLSPDGLDRTGDYAHQDHTCARMFRVGKKVAGRLLDGREWNEFPEVKP